MRSAISFTLHATLAAALIAFAAGSAAAADAYLKLGSIKGERAEGPGKGEWIELESYQWGAARGIESGAKRESSAPSISEISVSKPMDKSTPKLMEAATEGKVFASPLPSGSMTFKGQLTGCAVGTRYPEATAATPYFTYKFQDIMISSCSGHGGGGESLPMEEISMSYGKVETIPVPADQRQSGKWKPAGWDLAKAKGN